MSYSDHVEIFPFTHCFKEVISEIAQGGFEVSGDFFLRVENSVRKAVRIGAFPDEFLVEIRGAAAERIVHVGDVEVKAVFGREKGKDVEKGKAVRSAGNADDDARILFPELVSEDEVLDPLDEAAGEGRKRDLSRSGRAF